MTLLYDLTATQPSSESKFHGGGVYGEVVFFKLLEYLNDTKLVCYYNSKSYLNSNILTEIKKNKITLYDINSYSLQEIIEKEKINRLYSALLNLNQNIPLGKIEIYTTVHGLRTLEMPFDKIMLKYASSIKEKVKYRLFMGIAKRYYLKKLKIINGRLITDTRINVITISKHSLASMKSFFPELKDKKIPVFASPTFSQLENYKSEKEMDIEKNKNELFEKIGIKEKKYFLITSAARWTKNALRAVWAFDELFSDYFAPEFKVVVTGITNKNIFTKKLKNSAKFVFLNYIDRDFLETLTANQYAFIYPSLNEGFGYPPVESFKYGIPVAASGTSSIPEVCGNAAIYFDPYSITEIKNRIIQLLDKNIYQEYSKRALEQYKVISEQQKEDLQKLVEYIIKS